MRPSRTQQVDPRSTVFVVLGLIAVAPQPGAAQGTRLLRDPDVGSERIVFVHANDLWLVGRDGGDALRLTSGDGAETDPAFSPDGRWIAFTGEYGGDPDVYVVPVTGGEPRRLTWHPGEDVVQGWTADGAILFRSSREGQPTRLWRLYTVGLEGGLPKALPVHQAYHGEMSADGAWLAYQEIGYWDPEWRNYRGGQAQPVRVVSTASLDLLTPPWEGERQMAPVWMDGVVYYMSERDWASNVWSWNPGTGEEKQLTFHADFDVKSLGAGYGVVVYEQGGYLHEVVPATGATRRLEIRVARDLNWARPRWEDVPGDRLRDARLSPTGKRALFEYRGDLFTVPAEDGSWRNITRSPGLADRHAVWSPDGKKIAWFNDEGGEYGLVLADQDGGNARRIEIPDPTFFFVPTWSPDGTRLAFTDTDYRLLILDLESGDLTHADTDRYAHPRRTMNPVWSPDSRWIAYARRLDNQLRAIFVHDTRSGETRQLTDGMADAITPVWDASGKYLYFLASTDFGLNTGWLDMTSYDRPVTRALYLAILREGEASPFLPASDEETGADEENSDESSGNSRSSRGSRGDRSNADSVEVVIDFDGIARRIVDAPDLPLRDYVGLVEGPEGHVFVAENVPNERGFTLHRYALADREAKVFLERVNEIAASHDREKLLYRSGNNWAIVDAGGSPPKGDDGRLSLNGMRIRVEPRAEWAQMLRDGWRFMRDFLYVDNVHGAPWDDVWGWYSPWLEDVYHRSDFNHLLDMLSGEVAVGHSYVRGGDYPELTDPRTGLLGVDLEEADGFYRIARIYSGEDWTPELDGPLSLPGMNVSEGDYLVAIEGRELRPPANPYALLEGTAGRTIAVTVNDRPSLEGARDVVVEPVSDERALRTWAWVEQNRMKVDEMSGGRLAYVWLPTTGRGGYTYFNRMFFAQQDRQGAVIDDRNNGGGSAADYIVEVLGRQLTGYFNSRAGDRKPFPQPMAGLWGPKVMIINERAGSGGDLLPYLFRFKGVGPLVGTRTWGGLVGTWDTPPLLDGGRFVAPRGGFFDVNGEWAVEGEGVAPDIEVRNEPKPVSEGRDPQLERAVQEALRLLETEAIELKSEPPAPVKWRRPKQ
ncbi:MAG: PD40 domain-containing protein [Gemmatimonadota bacterium]|nr:MAG: PD40 domain-containing protein [Gemmatimonadota bacterium]